MSLRNTTHINDKSIVYMDNNAICAMSDTCLLELIQWSNKGNPSSSYKSAQEAAELMDDFKTRLIQHVRAPQNALRIIITSGATESNNTILKIVQKAYLRSKGKPHFIASAVEHSSILEALEQMHKSAQIDLDLVQPAKSGCISPYEMINKVKHNTALIICMHANNETGALNDITELTRLAHEQNIPVFSDLVQSFGRHPINWPTCDIDAFSVSFHKFGGAPGCGILAIREAFLRGYHLEPLICGAQNNHLRGGTENIPAIAASRCALIESQHSREKKNKQLCQLKTHFLNQLSKELPIIDYVDFTTANKMVIVLLSPKNSLCNTILLSVYDPQGIICNSKLKKYMEDQNVIVSIGSACNTEKKTASHVLYAMGCDYFVKRGALRISMSDRTTKSDVDNTLLALLKGINEIRK